MDNIKLTHLQADVLESLRSGLKPIEAAKKMEIKQATVRKAILRLLEMEAIERIGQGAYAVLIKDYAVREFNHPIKQDEFGIAISERERAWMLQNYLKYRSNRGEVARILGKPRFVINLMAIQLKLAIGEVEAVV